jgi:hypothetical protein
MRNFLKFGSIFWRRKRERKEKKRENGKRNRRKEEMKADELRPLDLVEYRPVTNLVHTYIYEYIYSGLEYRKYPVGSLCADHTTPSVLKGWH